MASLRRAAQGLQARLARALLCKSWRLASLLLAFAFAALWACMIAEVFMSHLGETVVLDLELPFADSPYQTDCSFETCFDLSLCAHVGRSERLGVYVYPDQIFVDPKGEQILGLPSRDYAEILTAIRHSRFAETDPSLACVFVPSSVDTLNLARIKSRQASSVLRSSPK